MTRVEHVPVWRGVAGLVLLGGLAAGCGGGSTATPGPPSTGTGPLGPVAPLTRLGPSRTTGTAPRFAVLCSVSPTTAPPGVVPAVVGLNLQDAVDRLTCAAFQVVVVPPTASATGVVVAQAPSAGSPRAVGRPSVSRCSRRRASAAAGRRNTHRRVLPAHQRHG